MPTDITRNSFDPSKSFSRVIRQQGRMDLDADFNEQADILLHLHRAFVRDLIGSYCAIDDAFILQKPTDKSDDLVITPGVCYVDGIRIEAPSTPAPLLYSKQPWPDTGRDSAWADVDYLAFLDVCERDVTATEDQSLLEPALQGADTSARTQVIWQVKLRKIPDNSSSFSASTHDKDGLAGQAWRQIIRNDLAPNATAWNLPAATMAATARDPASNTPTSPKYIGDCNQLYRIEIHTGGDRSTATFKWSRDNAGTVFCAVTTPQKSQLKLDPAHPADGRSLKVGDTMEMSARSSIAGDGSAQLCKITHIKTDPWTITIDANIPAAMGSLITLRKWDRAPVAITESQWTPIEQGISIRFDAGRYYQPGEYWLIPARGDTSDILWPTQADNQPASLPSTGGHHHYAPLAVIQRRDGAFGAITPTRRSLSRKNFLTEDLKGS